MTPESPSGIEFFVLLVLLEFVVFIGFVVFIFPESVVNLLMGALN